MPMLESPKLEPGSTKLKRRGPRLRSIKAMFEFLMLRLGSSVHKLVSIEAKDRDSHVHARDLGACASVLGTLA